MLKFKLLTCQQVATLASDYLDNHTDKKLSFKIRMHLMMCSNCRRFVQHLKITKDVTPQFVAQHEKPSVDAEVVLNRIKKARRPK